MMTTAAAIRDLLRRWAEAEKDSDAAALDKLATRDFQLDGPRGAVVDRAEWLDRVRKGAYARRTRAVADAWIRVYRDAAIAIVAGTTVIAVREGEGDRALWYLGGIHERD